MAKYSIGSAGVSITSGRGASKTTIEVSFKALDDWAKKMRIDAEKLMKQSFANACSGLKKKFIQVI